MPSAMNPGRGLRRSARRVPLVAKKLRKDFPRYSRWSRAIPASPTLSPSSHQSRNTPSLHKTSPSSQGDFRPLKEPENCNDANHPRSVEQSPLRRRREWRIQDRPGNRLLTDCKEISRPTHLKRSERGTASGREGLAGNRWLYSAPFYWTTECYWALDGAVECVSMALNSVSAMVSMPLSLG